jgi:hypothetical protein
MRLLLACIIVFLAPAGAFLITGRYLDVLEREFLEDADRQVARLDDVQRFYPPNAKTMTGASAIRQLRDLGSGGKVAAIVCSGSDSPYRRLFERLTPRCAQWRVYRWARRLGLFSILLSVGVWVCILVARIIVRRYAGRRDAAGSWNNWLVARGIPLLLALHVAVTLAGCGVILKDATGRGLFAMAILLIPFLGLFWLERRLVTGFIEPEMLGAVRRRKVVRIRRRRVA